MVEPTTNLVVLSMCAGMVVNGLISDVIVSFDCLVVLLETRQHKTLASSSVILEPDQLDTFNT